MIDPENQVFNTIYDTLTTLTDGSGNLVYPDISISGEYVRTPPSFPHVSITMSDSYVAYGEQTTNESESLAYFMFEVNVYSNKQNGKKSECKAIMQVIDKELFSLNMRRTAMTPVPNLEDATIFRLVARYVGATDGQYFHRR